MPFDPFSDFETRGYLRNRFGFKDSEMIKTLERIAFQDNLGEALAYLLTKQEIGYKDLLETHKILFESVYPWAGQDRLQTSPTKKVSKVGIEFALPNDIKRATEYGLGRGQDRAFMKRHPGEVMGYLAFGHPFLDGNGRALLTVHTVLAQKSGFNIAWSKTTKNGYLSALTKELNEPGKGHLDQYLRPFKENFTVEDLQQHLLEIKGLSGSSSR